MANYVTIQLPVKPFVRHYVEQRFGSPARFYKDRGISSYLHALLGKVDRRLDFRGVNTSVYSEVLDIVLSVDTMERFGYSLSVRAVLDLNHYFEDSLKMLMRSWCAAQYAHGVPASLCVRLFQDTFGFADDIWKYEAIYKDCQRNDVFLKGHINNISNKIHELFLAQMSRNRTFKHINKLAHDKD